MTDDPKKPLPRDGWPSPETRADAAARAGLPSSSQPGEPREMYGMPMAPVVEPAYGGPMRRARERRERSVAPVVVGVAVALAILGAALWFFL